MRIGLFTYSRTLLLITLLFATIPSFAYNAGIAVDTGFGSSGFTAIPPYDGTYAVGEPIGFVRMPLSGGYMAFSKQTKAGVDKIVAARFTDSGALNTAWGNSGRLVYALPTPTGSDAVVVVGVEGGVERVYVVARFISGSAQLMVASIGADGSFLNFSSTPVQNAFQNYGVGEILAAATGSTVPSGQGVLIAVKGSGAASPYVAIVGASFANGTPGNLYSQGYVLSRPTFRITRMQDRGDGRTDILGTEGNQSVYIRFNPSNFSGGTTGYIEAEKFFNLPCETGFDVSSVADGMVRPSGFGGDALISGRVQCSNGDAYTVAARVTSIESAPSVMWGKRMEAGLNSGNGCTPPFSGSTCISANLIASSNTEALITTTAPGLAHVNLGATPALLTGTEYNVATPFVLPCYRYGSSYQYPYIVAMGSNGGQLGMSRIAVDRLFADGVEAAL